MLHRVKAMWSTKAKDSLKQLMQIIENFQNKLLCVQWDTRRLEYTIEENETPVKYKVLNNLALSMSPTSLSTAFHPAPMMLLFSSQIR